MFRTAGPFYKYTGGNTVATGAFSAVGTIRIPRGGVVEFVNVGTRTGDGPILIQIDVFPEGTVAGGVSSTIASGWVRGGSASQARAHLHLRWNGSVPTKQDAFVRFFARNDTGSTVTVDGQVAGHS